MERYQNLNGNSGVRAFVLGVDYIDVQFESRVYRYSYRSAGSMHVEHMKKLARQGAWLNSYIMRYVRNAYER